MAPYLCASLYYLPEQMHRDREWRWVEPAGGNTGTAFMGPECIHVRQVSPGESTEKPFRTSLRAALKRASELYLPQGRLEGEVFPEVTPPAGGAIWETLPGEPVAEAGPPGDLMGVLPRGAYVSTYVLMPKKLK